MRTAFVLLIAAILAGCSSGTTPPSTSTTSPASTTATPASAAATPSAPASANGPVQQKLQEVAGSGATNCGDVKTLSGAELTKASDCAMQAAKDKKPFLVSYEMPGMSVGVAAGSDGKLYTVQSEEEAGKPAAPKSQPCPAELRVAQSGRVTCMPPGGMGVAPGSGNPHAAPGGMGTPPPGTPNPHSTAQAPTKSH